MLVGTLHTTHKCKIEINFPQLSPTRNIHWDVHVTTNKSQYDLIIGHDLMTQLGIDIKFSTNQIVWNVVGETSMPSDTPIPTEKPLNTLSFQKDDVEAARVKQILDAKYVQANIADLANSYDHLSLEE